MPDLELYSEKEALNLALPGGRWDEQTALVVSTGAHAALTLDDNRYLELEVWPQHEIYYKFDLLQTDTISAANSMKMTGGVKTVVKIPYSIGQQAADKSVVFHVKQVGSTNPSTVRVVAK